MGSERLLVEVLANGVFMLTVHFRTAGRAQEICSLAEFVDPNDPLWKEVENISLDEGMVLYDFEKGGNALLRVYVAKSKGSSLGDDACSAQQGVNVEDCARLVRRLMVYFLAEGERLGVGVEPELEVSSPGINRQLRLPTHFAGAIGERVKLSVAGGEGGRSYTLVGQLSSQSLEKIEVVEEDKGQLHTIPTERVRKARIDFKFAS